MDRQEFWLLLWLSFRSCLGALTRLVFDFVAGPASSVVAAASKLREYRDGTIANRAFRPPSSRPPWGMTQVSLDGPVRPLNHGIARLRVIRPGTCCNVEFYGYHPPDDRAKEFADRLQRMFIRERPNY